MDQMASTCQSSCSTCHHQASDYLLVDSPDKLYLAVTLSVHQKGERPLECGSLDGDKVCTPAIVCEFTFLHPLYFYLLTFIYQ